MPAPDLTVVIPVAPDDLAWTALLAQLPQGWSIVVSAATPRPSSLAASIRWHHGKPGRGRQLNAGAALAESHWLWFLHADSRLDSAACKGVTAWCAQRKNGLGYLDLEFLGDGPALTRLNALGANLRSRLFGLPYGDQGLCISAAEFWRLGGFREDLERGEDLDFVVRARSAGLPAGRMPGRIQTSARRYREHGWLRTTWQHQLNARRLIRQAKSGPQDQRAA
jgi:hypothetical protein